MIIDIHAHLEPSREYGPDELLADMDAVGIEKAVLLQNPTIGTINERVRDAVAAHPDRFVGTIQVDPYAEDAKETIQAFHSPAQRILKLELSEEYGWSSQHPGLQLEEECLQPIWQTVESLGLHVIIDPGHPENNGYQVEAIDRLSTKYQQTHFVLEHLGYILEKQYGREDIHARWTNMLSLGKKPNVYFGCSAVPILLNDRAPFERSLELMKRAVERIGTEKIVWGSDAPSVLDTYGYGELVELVREAEFLDDGQKQDVLYGNALKVFPELI